MIIWRIKFVGRIPSMDELNDVAKGLVSLCRASPAATKEWTDEDSAARRSGRTYPVGASGQAQTGGVELVLSCATCPPATLSFPHHFTAPDPLHAAATTTTDMTSIPPEGLQCIEIRS